MIIVLGSQKGGVGKSTLAVSIAAYLMSLGNRVIIVDADDQKSVLTWYNNRPEDCNSARNLMTLSSQTVLAATVQKCVVG